MLTQDNFLDYMDRVTPQWIAGLFDGEGCVHARIDNKGNTRFRISIAQKNKFLLVLICHKFPGSDFHECTQTVKEGTAVTNWWELVWVGRTAIPFLVAIKDYIIFKHEAVIKALEFTRLIEEGYNFVSSEAREKREALVAEICEINKKNHTYKVV